MRIQALDEQGAPLASGLSRLAYANDGNPAALGEVQASVDARVKINGLAVESASNRISGAISTTTKPEISLGHLRLFFMTVPLSVHCAHRRE